MNIALIKMKKMTDFRQTSMKRIAKNTLLLYFRMLVIMLVSLYTSRMVLDALGVEDYGLYNVVGGIVVILSFLNGAMAASTQRFLNFELGRNNENELRKVFSSSVIIHLVVALLVVLLAESIGLFFLNTYMNISSTRLTAANWVYQFSVAATAISISSIPYNAVIIAHEKMSAFAYISILEAAFKLSIALLIGVVSFDRLVFYAFLLLCLNVIIRLVYVLYCKKHFEECKNVVLVKDKKLFRKMLSFSSWTIIGNLAYIFHTQGIAIILNIFFGATVNAAQGVSNQVNGVVSSFVHNFMIAMKPQIVKNYASGNLKDMYELILSGSKFSFFLVLIFVVPLSIETPYILHLWLKEVPEHTVMFIRLLLFVTLFDSFNSLLNAAQGATGKIKQYMITMTCVSMLHLPLSYWLFKLGYAPYYAMVVYLALVIVMQNTRIFFVCKSVNLSLKLFYKAVVLRCLAVLSFSYISIYIILQMVQNVYAVFTFCFIISLFFICLIGLNKRERTLLYTLINKYVPRRA